MKRAGEAQQAAAATRSPLLLAEDIHDRQPLLSADGNVLFVCQARLDNRSDLLRELRICGDPNDISDSTILHEAFLRWHHECVNHIYGDFAFAAFDNQSGEVLGAVDHVNHYRLFYRETGKCVLLSTQLAALSQCPGLEATLDPGRLGLFAEARGGRTRTVFREVHALEGGHLLRWRAGRTEVRRWWNPVSKPIRLADPEEYVTCTRNLLTEAVRHCLRSSSSISSTLSGGLDSGLVNACAANLLGDAGTGLTAYTSAPAMGVPLYRRPRWEPDDAPYAADTAARYPNIRHIVLRGDGRVALEIASGIHRRSGTPVRNGANHLWIDAIARAANAEGSRIILTGARGNFGVSHMGLGAFRELLLSLHWGAALRFATSLHASGERPAWKTVATGIAPQEAFQRLRDLWELKHPSTGNFPKVTTTGFRRRYRRELKAARRPERTRAEFVRRAISPAMLWSADPLAQWGVELRDPLSDRRLTEMLLSFPLDAFVQGGRLRGLAREVGKGLLPDTVRLRSTQGQQAADYAAAVRNHAARYQRLIAAMSASDPCRDIFDTRALEQAIARIKLGETSAVLTGQLDRACDAGLFILSASAGGFSF